MRDALKSYLALAGGATEVTRRKALEAARALVAAKKAAAKKSPAKKSPAASAGT